MGIARRIELDCQFLTLSHLTEIRKVSTDDRHAKGARQMGYSAATGRRRIRHHGDAGFLE
jgi:hypothetical protein